MYTIVLLILLVLKYYSSDIQLFLLLKRSVDGLDLALTAVEIHLS